MEDLTFDFAPTRPRGRRYDHNMMVLKVNEGNTLTSIRSACRVPISWRPEFPCQS